MSSSPHWCHSCHNIVRISSSLSLPLTCPSCGFGFVEEINSDPTLLLVSPSHLPVGSDLANNNVDEGRTSSTEASSDVGGRLGFLRHLFRHTTRRNRSASEARPSILQLLELLQRSRSREGSADGTASQHRDPQFSLMNDEGTLLNFDGVSRTVRINGEERFSGGGLSPVLTSEVENPQDDAVGRRPLDLFLQRLLSTLLQSGRNGSPPASKAAVAAMPTFKISKRGVVWDTCSALLEAGDECAVCKEVFEIGGEVKEMPCKHVYHSNCILPWLELHSSCPLCRHEMPVDAEEQASSSNTLEGGGEPTIVFIGISSGGIYAFSFMILGVGNRTESMTPDNQERVQGIQASNMIEEETTADMGDGVTVHVDFSDEVDDPRSFASTAVSMATFEGHVALNESTVSSENRQHSSSNIGDSEQSTEENESCAKDNGYPLLSNNNHEHSQSGSCGGRESRLDKEGECNSPHDDCGTEISTETRMHQLRTGSGARAESSTSGSREGSSLSGEGKGPDAPSMVESSDLHKNEA